MMRQMKIVVTALSLALLLGLGASSQEQPARVANAADASIHGYGDHDRTCRLWTNGCQTCSRADDDEQFCSNIGLACQPVAISCAERSEPAK
jgi:hypothetical protein